MDKGVVDAIEALRDGAGGLVNQIKAKTPEEWEALERLTAAHKTLRSIDTGQLRQTRLDLTK